MVASSLFTRFSSALLLNATVFNSDDLFYNCYKLLLLERKEPEVFICSSYYCWFSHDVKKIQTTKLSILPRFYFHDVLEQLKTNFHTNFRFKRVLGFVIEYA